MRTRFLTCRVPVAAASAGLLGLAVLLGGCTAAKDSVAPEPTTAPLDELDLSQARPGRTAFCDRVDPESAAALLGGEPERVVEYDSGDRARLAPGVVDVAHEHSCELGTGERSARAWVFAAPTDEQAARRLVTDARRVRGCAPKEGLRFGTPGVSLACQVTRGARGPRTTYRLAGLFGDAWLTCEVTVPRAEASEDAHEDAQRWCADLVLSLS